jgi:exosortase
MLMTIETPPIPSTAHGARTLQRLDLLIAAALAAVAIAVLFDAWKDIVRIGFTDEECSYVLLAPVVIGWLAWVRRGEAGRRPVRRGWVGLLIIAVGWMVHWYGYIHDPIIWRAGAVLVAVGALVTALGLDVSWVLWPALAACVFLIPVDPTGRINIAEPLQTAAASITQRICELLAMNVDRAGNLLSINGVEVTIAEACNGIRMVLTLFMVCYVVAFTVRLSTVGRALVLIASPLVAIVANVVRLVPTVWMFGHTSAKTAEAFHDVSGWVMTVLAFLALMGFCWLLQGEDDKGISPAERGAALKGASQ